MSKSLCLIILPAMLLWGCTTSLQVESQKESAPPLFSIRPAPPLTLPGANDPNAPGVVDCNSPAHWDGDALYVFSSTGHPYRSSGADLARLQRPSEKCHYDSQAPGGRWIEATWKAPDGKLYGWYHLEPHPVCDSPTLTAPQIGAAVSSDNGLHWHDLGIVLTAPPDSMNCGTGNRYFSGGNGDFSVLLDVKRKDYFYFLISTYNRDVAEQGVAIARIAYADRDAPAGKVFKWHRGQWQEPGLGGHVSRIFPVAIDWHRADADALWGPSVSWNTHLRRYVMLLNRARDKEWAQEGIYISTNADIANPAGWSTPRKILDASELPNSKWYPQLIGLGPGETDKNVGRRARLFVAGTSKWVIDCLQPGEISGQD